MVNCPSSWCRWSWVSRRGQRRTAGSVGSDPTAVRSLSTDEVASLGVEETLARLGSSRDGLSTVEATARLDRLGPNEVEERHRSVVVEFLTRFWGPIPWMIEAAFVLVGGRRTLGGRRDHRRAAGHERSRRLLGGAPGGQCDRRAEGTAGIDGPGSARRHLGVGPGGGPRSGRCDPGSPGESRPRRRMCLVEDAQVEVDQSALTGESLPVTRSLGESYVRGIGLEPRRGRRGHQRNRPRDSISGRRPAWLRRRRR